MGGRLCCCSCRWALVYGDGGWIRVAHMAERLYTWMVVGCFIGIDPGLAPSLPVLADATKLGNRRMAAASLHRPWSCCPTSYIKTKHG